MRRALLAVSLVLSALPAHAQQRPGEISVRPVNTELDRPSTELDVSPQLNVNPELLQQGFTERAEADVALDSLNVSTLARFGIAQDSLGDRDIAVFDGGSLTTVTPDNAAELVSPSALLVERTGGAVTERAGPSGTPRYTLPIRFTQFVETAGTARMLEYLPEVMPTAALRYHGDRGAYFTKVGVGVFEPDPGGEQALGADLGVFLSSLSLDSIDPGQVQFAALNAFVDVDVTISNVASTPTLTVRPNFAQESFEVPIPIGPRPTATISFDDASIPGLGLRTATANIHVSNVENPQGISARFNIDGGHFVDGGRAVFDSDGRASLAVRSIGIGSATMTSDDPLFASVTGDTIEFTIPWLFAAAIILGGLAGTVATRRSREKFVGAAIAGIATGAIVAAAYSVGINLLAVEPSATVGEALVFVLSALGAVAGPAILKK